MAGSKAIWFFVVLSISMLLSWTNPRGETLKSFSPSPLYYSNSSTQSASSSNDNISSLKYDFYHEICPKAESIIRTSVARIYSDHSNVSAALLRLFFHDCFIEGCDASVLLDDSNGNKNYSIEKQAIPNQTLKGFDKIDSIKEELEKACPEVVSCADIVSIASRDGIMLAGCPFYPVLTGRRDSNSIHSYFSKALAEIPQPNDNITQTLHLFALTSWKMFKFFFGAHNIGIGCEFIQRRLSNLKGTGTTTQPSSSMASLEINEAAVGMTYLQALSSSISSGEGFETHYYQSQLNGRGLLFADQQLMANEKTARLVRAYASDDGSTFRMDFARAMMKMSGLTVLTGSQGQN
ncbi:hypothetical protein ACJW30_11G027300 [Castanea mollissima]